MYINGLKYACSTCIKGHRSSSCNHVDRPLFEIRKKGRPSSQCAYCKDSRKTKQVQIKCICNSKKGEQSQPLLMYRNNNSNNVVSPNCPAHSTDKATQSEQCICLLNNSIPVISSTSVTQPQLLSNVSQEPLMSAPLCTSQFVKKENYSWALVTSPPTNNVELPRASTFSTVAAPLDQGSNNTHLGFTFHKPSNTSRLLDGRPKVHRRRSAKKSPTPTRTLTEKYDTMVNADTLNHLATPSPSMSTCSGPVDMQFDYLNQHIEDGSKKAQNTVNAEDFVNTGELSAILNNMLQNDHINIETMGQNSHQIPHTVPSHTFLSPSTTSTSYYPQSFINNPGMNRSYCGSFVPRSNCCQPIGNPGGESVVITITPLGMSTKESHHDFLSTTTRIVTCYCGSQCSCPGCLVHPGNSILGSDPYSGTFVNPSSTSSSCYGSDDDDIMSNYSNPTNFNF